MTADPLTSLIATATMTGPGETTGATTAMRIVVVAAETEAGAKARDGKA